MRIQANGKTRVMAGALLLVGLLAAGCVVGPNYHAPKVQMPGQWTGSSAAAGNAGLTTSNGMAVEEWWKSFHDSELDSLVHRAIESNLNLQEAQSRILQARAAQRIAGAGRWPNINASGANATSGSGSLGTTGSGTTTRNLFQSGLDAAWEMDLFGGVRRGIEAAGANIQAAIEDSHDVMVTLTAEVALNYMEIRGLQQQLAIAQKNLTNQINTAAITRKRFGVGFASALDVANADAQAATTRSQIPLLESSTQQATYALSVLLAKEPSALLEELSSAGNLPEVPPLVPVGLPSDLLKRRPDILRAEAQLHAATAQVGVATADLFPKFSLTGSAGVQNLTQGTLANTAGYLWSLGPSVSLPIFNAGKVRANIDIQKEAVNQALLAYRQTVLTALQDVESALIAYAKDQQHRLALSEAVKANETAVDLSLKLYTAGETEFLNLLTAEHNLYSSEDATVQASRAMDDDLIALYKALGGGWQIAAMATGQMP